MKLIKILFFIPIFFTFIFAKGGVSKIFAHKEIATSSSYKSNGYTYKWGEGNNIVIDGFEYNGHHYNYVSESPIIKIRRSDNPNATGEPCGLFAAKKNNKSNNKYRLEPTFPKDCDMAKVMGGRIINIGALDLFKNGNDSYDTPKNIERVDFISPNGIVAPSKISSLAKAGHVVTEKSGNNEIKIAAILSLDANGDPSSFGPLVTVHDQNGDAKANRKVDYGNTYIYLDDGSIIGTQKLGFYRNEKKSPQTPKPTHTGDSTEKLDMAFVSLEDLGISVGQKYYGFAYFGSDVYDNMNLVDYSSFPKNTPWNALHHTDTADPYGGVASYFVDKEISYDFGDAPNQYTHVSHKISKDLYLGSSVPDVENDQQSSTDATGDGEDDSDGVGTPPILMEGGSSYSVPVKVFNNTGTTAYITAWIDFNKNGIFEYDEALNTNNLYVTSSTDTQTINVTWDNFTDSNTTAINNATVGTAIMRIRLSTSRILRCDSEHYSNNEEYSDNYLVSPDGEVEDYVIKIGTSTVKGQFNIERTNSENYFINSNDRNAWYTQIAGRDFDYSLVFYKNDFSAEQNISKIPVKIELFDIYRNKTIYERYIYINESNSNSRFDFLSSGINKNSPTNDLGELPASKEVIFRVTYPKDSSGNIIQSDCLGTAKECFDAQTSLVTDDAKDKFAIRPEKFYVSIADGTKERVNSTSPNPISFASGYDYNLSVKAIKYFHNYPNFNASEGYNGTVVRNLHFITTGSCINSSDQDKNITFNNGFYRDSNFSNPYVGEYKLNIIDDSTWTAIDQNGRDCIDDSNITSTGFNEPSGCNIAQVDDIDIEFQPDHFAINLDLGVLPNSGHQDFIYMSELNSTYSDVAVQFLGEVVAQNRNNQTTKNFTNGCVAKNVLLDLSATTLSVEGTNQQIHTIAGTDVNFSRHITYNPNSINPTNSINRFLVNLNGSIVITPDKFLDENNGTVELDMRYNLNKHLREPINPVQVTFNSIEVSSAEANSISHDNVNVVSDIHTPSGFKTFPNNVKNFYFARVVSDFDNYPRVNMNVSPIVRTPLNVDIYCKTNIANYCENRGVIANSNLTATTREAYGWYLSAEHNATVDGNVINLMANPPIVTITPDSDPSPTINEITLPNGRNGMVIERFQNCSSTSSTITITTSPALAFEPSQYVVYCTDVKSSQWTGVGRTGNVLEVKPKINPLRKIEW